jgi:sterol desaturase/sphingolipid hydroxylase (fatty acid hydroxylase superfamily)
MSDRLYIGVTYLLVSATAYVFAIVVESLLAKRKRARGVYGPKATKASLGIIAGHFLIGLLWNSAIVIPLFHFAHLFAPFQIGAQMGDPLRAFFSVSTLALVLIDDFVYYVHHRICHRFRFFWAIHHTHHSTNEYNVLVAARISWFDINTITFWLPLTLIGFDPDLVITIHFLNLMVNIFIHTKLVGHLPILDELFMTPSNHRVHHAINPIYRNKNYGGALVLWDKLFGTYIRESEPVIYESSPELADENVVKIATHGVRTAFVKSSDRRSEGA